MKPDQTAVPRQWLVADTRLRESLWPAIARLPAGSGILFLYRDLPTAERAALLEKLAEHANARGLVIADEAAGQARRVHYAREIGEAEAAAVPLLFLSPVFATRSHPEWKPLAPAQAQALIRLASVPVIALGGMDASRFEEVKPLGFSGWAGIDAWLPRT